MNFNSVRSQFSVLLPATRRIVRGLCSWRKMMRDVSCLSLSCGRESSANLWRFVSFTSTLKLKLMSRARRRFQKLIFVLAGFTLAFFNYGRTPPFSIKKAYFLAVAARQPGSRVSCVIVLFLLEQTANSSPDWVSKVCLTIANYEIRITRARTTKEDFSSVKTS